MRQPRFGLSVPLLPYHRPAPVAAALGKAVEHTPLGQRVFADGVSHSPTVGRLPKECRHYRLPVVGPVVVEMGRGVARVQQPLLRYNRLGHWGSSLWSTPRGVRAPPGLSVVYIIVIFIQCCRVLVKYYTRILNDFFYQRNTLNLRLWKLSSLSILSALKIGHSVRELRVVIFMTQEDLARASGISLWQ